MRAIWNGQVLATSDQMVVVEWNHYFPRDSLRQEFFVASDTKSVCPWKGEASYYTVSFGGRENADAAWYYPDPKPAAAEIAGLVSFWRGVVVEE